ncbi:MAG TPA: cupin domain-containing protein [Solirubrobacteraceae bacterium]|jgi:quercetin dioxygenase-like cupin family protein|nr:cupin domain-containing protein [Solirubrobacteraceae bacterium]
MATTGTTIASPPIGQAITFLTTAADSDGALLELEAVMAPGSSIPPHVHVHQEERWRVLDGTATFKVDGRTVTAAAGDELAVPARTPHSFRNRTEDEVRLRATLLPALRAEDLFTALFQLGAPGKVNRLGAPSPLATARLIRQFREEFFYLAHFPVALQRLLAGARR